MAFVKVASVAQLPPDSLTEVMLDGNPIALCNAGGSIRALWGTCPHQGGPLGQGALNGDNITCPWHAWEFNCVTGESDFDPDVKVSIFPVQVNGDDILIDFEDTDLDA